MKALLSRWLPALVWAAFILLASSIPEPLETAPAEIASFLQITEILGVGGVTLVSLLIHFTLYLVLGFLVARALMLKSGCNPRSVEDGLSGAGQDISVVSRHHEMSGQAHLLLSLALCLIFAFIDERYQLTVPGRGFEWIDLLADGVGSVIGIALWVFVRKRVGDSL